MNIIRILIRKLPVRLYICILNISKNLKKEKIFLAIDDGIVKIDDLGNNITWYAHRERLHLYLSGMKERGKSIGKSYLLDGIVFKDGDVVVDCGANMGDLQLYFYFKKITINYFGIEPNPLDYKCLIRNALDNSKIMNIALWDSRSELKFYVDSSSASSSLIEPPKFSEVISVNASRMDQLDLPNLIKLFKVEGEGAEPEILLGSTGILKRIEYVSVDAGPERGINQLSTKTEVCRILKKNGFSIVKENPFHRKTILFKNNNFKHNSLK